MFPSIRTAERHRPSRGSGSNTERWSTGHPRRRAASTALGDVSMPSAIVPRSARGGPAPVIDGLDVVAVGTLREAIAEALETDSRTPAMLV